MCACACVWMSICKRGKHHVRDIIITEMVVFVFPVLSFYLQILINSASETVFELVHEDNPDCKHQKITSLSARYSNI